MHCVQNHIKEERKTISSRQLHDLVSSSPSLHSQNELQSSSILQKFKFDDDEDENDDDAPQPDSFMQITIQSSAFQSHKSRREQSNKKKLQKNESREKCRLSCTLKFRKCKPCKRRFFYDSSDDEIRTLQTEYYTSLEFKIVELRRER